MVFNPVLPSSNWAKLVQQTQHKTTQTDASAKQSLAGHKRKRPDQLPTNPVNTTLTNNTHALASLTNTSSTSNSTAVSISVPLKPVPTPLLAIDCEMVGVGEEGIRSILARCSLVNQFAQVIYDKYVQPTEEVTDYRTAVSGITPQLLYRSTAIIFTVCQREVAELIEGRILVGHSIESDLQALMLSHPRHLIRDTARYKLLCPHRPLSLRHLVKQHLDVVIQDGEHDSVIDAKAVLKLYQKFRKQWEAAINKRHHLHHPNSKTTQPAQTYNETTRILLHTEQQQLQLTKHQLFRLKKKNREEAQRRRQSREDKRKAMQK